MNNISKQDIEQCVKKVIQQSHIPDENIIRNIVREEIEKYHEKEESEQKEPFSDRINEYFQNKKYKNIGWYIIMFFVLFVDVLGFKILTQSTQQLFQNFHDLNIINCILFILISFLITVIALYISVNIYDKMIKVNYKNARIICLLEILYWCNVLFPNVSQWIENIL